MNMKVSRIQHHPTWSCPLGRLGEEAVVEMAYPVGVTAFETRRVACGQICDGGERNEGDARHGDSIEAGDGKDLGAGDHPQPPRLCHAGEIVDDLQQLW
jgi:hypothetical protein